MTRPSRLTELNEIIRTRTQAIQSHLEAKGLPEPSLELGAPLIYSLPRELQVAQSEVMNATIELNNLISGPFLHISNLVNPGVRSPMYLCAQIPCD